MSHPFKPLLRAAESVRERLCRPENNVVVGWNRAVDDLTTLLTDLEDSRRLAAKAEARGWHSAATVHRAKAAEHFCDVQQSAARLVREPQPARDRTVVPTVSAILAELRQLQDEFEDVVVDDRGGMISAVTDRIVLQEIDLGPFRIELLLATLHQQIGVGSFRCIATDPNSAASSDSTTHPHVQGGMLCGGEATTPIAAALRQGRIADAFLLIRSVLQTYNPDSPFVPLDHWSGASCDDCGHTTDSDSLYHCDECGNEVCEECESCCGSCDRSRCRSCLEYDGVEVTRLCSACRSTCRSCERTVDSDHVDADTGLCPGCLEEHNSNQEQENQDEDAEPQTAGTGPVVPEGESVNAAADGAAQEAAPAVLAPAAA